MKTNDMLHLVAESSLNIERMVLPDDEKHPLLNRQIVYTGITRAKKRAVIVGNEGTLTVALERKIERDTGIALGGATEAGNKGTQVFFQVRNDHVSRRFLHVQMVSRIARSIGRCLRLNEDLIEAIALGHDIGHTPCGHTGEAELARLLAKHGAGTFMHNAQSVRVLQHLEKGGCGLNLTLPVLDGILGHNGEIEAPVYEYDRRNLTWERLEANLAECMKTPGFDRQVFPSTLEGCVVRVSDIISYIGKDMEDAIAVGIIKRTDIPERCASVLGKRNTDIIGTLCTDIVEHSFGKGHLEFSPEVFEAYREMKAFNGARIYGCDLLAEQRGRFARMMAMLFEVYLDAVERDDRESAVWRDFLRHFPSSYRDETAPARIVADYLSLMTDQYFLKQYRAEFMTQEIVC